MTRITQKELDLLREQQEIYMPDTVTIRRREFFGDNEQEYFDLTHDVSARITPGFGFWRAVADRFQGITAFNVTMPWDTDVKASDVLVDVQSRAFEVRDVRSPSTFQTAKQVLCDMVTDG